MNLEKDLIPEGIAFDPHSKQVFVNSLRNNKIVGFDLQQKNTEEFIHKDQYDYLSGFGMEIMGDTLYALGNVLPPTGNRSILLLLSVSSGELLKSYSLDTEDFTYLNDIAISSVGDIYITDSENDRIYTVNREKDQLEVFYQNEGILHSNGISISPDNHLLYLASYIWGIRILNLKTKTLVNPPNAHKGIDGMKFYNGNLLAIVNGKQDKSQNGIYRFAFNEKGTKIIGSEQIHRLQKESDIPTTFALHNGAMFFIADSQMDNFKQETNEIIDVAKLEKYQLVQLELNSNPKSNKTGVVSKNYCTEIGRFDLLIDEDEVAGSYYLINKKALGGVWGRLNGNIMKGRWHDADGKGDITITFTDDFSFFTADYRSDDEPEKWYRDSWHGTLRTSAEPYFDFNNKTYRCE
nr:hypothetical protein [Allomuricauda sp.]